MNKMFRINSGQISQEEYSKHMNRMLMQQQQDRNRLEKGTTETIYKFTPMTGGNSMTATNNFHKMQQDACYKGYVNDANGRKIQNCEIFTGPLMTAGSHYANNAQAKTYIDTLLRARAKEIKASTEQEKLKPVNDRTNYKNEQLVEELDTMYEKVSDQVETYNINSFVFDELYKIIKKLQREAYLLRDNDISKYIEQSETIYEFVYDDKAIAKAGNKSLLDSVLLAITRIKKFLKAIKAYSHLPVDQRRGAIKSLSKLLNISSFDKKAILQRRQDRGDDDDDDVAPVPPLPLPLPPRKKRTPRRKEEEVEREVDPYEGASVDDGLSEGDPDPYGDHADDLGADFIEDDDKDDDNLIIFGRTVPQLKQELYEREISSNGYLQREINNIMAENETHKYFSPTSKVFLRLLLKVQGDMQNEAAEAKKPVYGEDTWSVGEAGQGEAGQEDAAADTHLIMVVNKKTIRAAYYTKPNGRNVKIPYYSQDFMENYKTINALKAFREKIGKGPSTSTNVKTVQKQLLKFLYE